MYQTCCTEKAHFRSIRIPFKKLAFSRELLQASTRYLPDNRPDNDVKVVFTKLQPKITSFTVFVLMNNSSIIFSNTGRLSGGGTQNPGTLSGRAELMMDMPV